MALSWGAPLDARDIVEERQREMRRRSPTEKALVKLKQDRRQVQDRLADGMSPDSILSTLDRLDYVPDISVDSDWAAMHLGICNRTLRNFRKSGVVRAFALPIGNAGKVTWRYLMTDLDEFINTRRNRKRYWDPEEDAELPVAVVARILGVTKETAHVQRSRGRLNDYRPESVRSYLLKSHSRKVARDVKRCAQSRESNLRYEICRLRMRLAKTG
jgi:hypothetical protein